MSTKKQEETSGERVIKSLSSKKRGKTKIVFEDGRQGTITDSAYLSAFLYPGKKLTEEEWAKLTGINEEDKVRKYVESLLRQRLYSPKQLIDKLVTVRSMSLEESEDLIKRLTKEGIVSPWTYAEDRIESLKAKGFSKHAILKDLERQDIPKDMIASLDEKLNLDNSDVVLRLLNQEVRKHHNESYRSMKKKLESFLFMKGYGREDCEEFLSSLSLENPSFSSDQREKEALAKVARSAYDRIKRSDKEAFNKKASFVRLLISKGFSREDIEEWIREEGYEFD